MPARVQCKTSSHDHTAENQSASAQKESFSRRKAIHTSNNLNSIEKNTMENFKSRWQDNHNWEYDATTSHSESQTLTCHNHNLKFREASLEKDAMATEEFKDKTVHEKEAKSDNHKREHQNRRYKNTLHLWEYLLELLSDERAGPLISWSRKEYGEFKIKDPNEVAKRWGMLKQKPRMNYDKLSRAIRSYYPRQIITKVSGQRLVYKFGKLPYQYMPGVVESHLAKRQWLSRARRSTDTFGFQTPSPSHSLSNSIQLLSLSHSVSPTAIVSHSTAPSPPTASFPSNESSLSCYQSLPHLVEPSSTDPLLMQDQDSNDSNESYDVVPLSAPPQISTAKFFSAIPASPTPFSLERMLSRRNSIPVSVITRNVSFRTISENVSP